MSPPRTRIVPACPRLTPAMSARSVDLPTPSGPTTAVAVPPGTESETSARAAVCPYRCETPSSVMAWGIASASSPGIGGLRGNLHSDPCGGRWGKPRREVGGPLRRPVDPDIGIAGQARAHIIAIGFEQLG